MNDRFDLPLTAPARVALILLCLLPSGVSAQPAPDAIRESLVQVAVMDDDDVERLGVGFTVADGFVLTAAHLVHDEEFVLAVPLTTKARLVADVVAADERLDLALLAVSGLTLSPARFALEGPETGGGVRSAGIWEASERAVFLPTMSGEPTFRWTEGAVGALREHPLPGRGTAAAELIEHNAMIPAAGYGGPLLDECGDVVGLNRGAPDRSRRDLRRGRGPQGVVHAVAGADVLAFVRDHGAEPVVSDESCADALEVAQAEAARTAEELEQSRQELETAAGEAEEARAELEQTQQDLEQTQQDLEAAAGEAAEAQSRVSDLEARYEAAVVAGDAERDSLREELEGAREEEEAARASVEALEAEAAMLRERQEAEAAASRSRLVAVTAAAILAALLAVVVFVGYRRRSREVVQARGDARRAQDEADAAREEASRSRFPSCVLSGQTGDGHAVSFRISGELLGEGGAVVGRSPRSANFVLDDGTVSRRHARLFAKGDAIHIEDLDTPNGTRINGNRLPPRTPTAVHPGDTIELGAVSIRLRVDSS